MAGIGQTRLSRAPISVFCVAGALPVTLFHISSSTTSPVADFQQKSQSSRCVITSGRHARSSLVFALSRSFGPSSLFSATSPPPLCSFVPPPLERPTCIIPAARCLMTMMLLIVSSCPLCANFYYPFSFLFSLLTQQLSFLYISFPFFLFIHDASGSLLHLMPLSISKVGIRFVQ